MLTLLAEPYLRTHLNPKKSIYRAIENLFLNVRILYHQIVDLEKWGHSGSFRGRGFGGEFWDAFGE